MKIVSVTALFPPRVIGGAERTAFSIASGLAARGHQVNVITLLPPGSTREITLRDGLTVHGLPLDNLYWPYATAHEQGQAPSPLRKLAWHLRDLDNRSMAREVARIIAGISPDAVITHNLQGFSTAVWPAIGAQRRPILHVLHDAALICPRTVLFNHGKRCAEQGGRCLDCRVLSWARKGRDRHVSAVAGVSAAVLALHRRHGWFVDTPGAVIRNALQPGAAVHARTREADDGKVHFGFLGRLRPEKGIDLLLAAASQLPTDRFELHVAGRGNPAYIDALMQRFNLPNIHFLGFVPADSLFRKIDALVFPTVGFEALGNGVFEAFAAGVPVLGSGVDGIAEMIEEGRNGLTFAPGDVAALRQALQRCIDEPGLLPQLALGALASAQGFGRQQQIDRFEAHLGEMIARHATGRARALGDALQ